MAIEHLDNFSIYGGNAALLLNGVYAEQDVTLVVDPDGMSPGRVASINNDLTNGLYTSLRYALQTGPVTKVGIAQRVWMNSLPLGDDVTPIFAYIRSAGNANLGYLRPSSNGGLIMQINGVDVETTPLPVITANGWWHIEIMYSSDGLGTCDYEVRVEGVPVLQGAGVAAAAFKPGQIAWGGRNSGPVLNPGWKLKDLAVWNGNGVYNNNFMGTILLEGLLTNADVALNWTPSVGADGWSILDNIPPNDAQYISAPNPPPAAYVGALTDLPVDVTTVKGLMTFVRAAKTDGGDASLRVSMVSGAATADGADRPITVAQTYWRDVFETDPNTLAPWLPEAVNLANIKINRTL